MKNKHTCHAIDCSVETKPQLLMCTKHWSMVPKDIQNDIYSNYKSGQCDILKLGSQKKVRPSIEWLKAARKAITHVRHAEGKASILRDATV